MKTSNKKISQLLLTTEEMDSVYQKLHKQKFKYPYFFKITRGNQSLHFLGPNHTFDPKNHQIKTIRKYWNGFLKDTNKKDCSVLIEGGERPVEKSENIAIKKHGEPGFTTFLASKEGVKAFSPEPDSKDITDKLLKNFSKEEIMYNGFAGRTAQWNRLVDKPDFNKYIGRFMKRNKKELRWKDFDFSLENFIRIHDKKHKHKFNKNNYKCFNADSGPFKSRVSAASGVIRDTYIVSEIKRFWDEGKNIFIVYDSGHAIVQEPALKKLLE